MPKGKGTYGNQRGRPRKDAASSMYQKRGPKYKRYSDVTSKTVDTIEEEQKAEVKKAEGKATKAAAMKDASSTMDRLIGSKKGEYKRRDKSAAHPEGHRAGDVEGHYKAYEKNESVEKAALEEIVNEVTDRVAKRLVKESLKRKLAKRVAK